MSYQRTIEGLRILNRELEALYDSGQPLMLDVNGAPVMRIDSFDPLVYEKYGRFLNRAPRIVGGAALRAFLSAPMPDNDAGAQVWIRSRNTSYRDGGCSEVTGAQVSYKSGKLE